MYTAVVTPEDLEIDVTYLHYDGSYTRKTYMLELFIDGKLVDTLWLKQEQNARLCAGLFEQGEFYYGSYGEILFDKAFKQEEITALILEDL